jgi:hypothetical protein
MWHLSGKLAYFGVIATMCELCFSLTNQAGMKDFGKEWTC